MKNSLKTGLNFGSTSGIITTLGLMVGLYSGTQSGPVVIGGILTIAIADAFSDALGIHISEESKNRDSKSIWEATIWTFLAKFFFAMVFIIPMVLLSLKMAIIASVIMGLVLLAIFSFMIAKNRDDKPGKTIFEHIGIAIVVIVVTSLVGNWIGVIFR